MTQAREPRVVVHLGNIGPTASPEEAGELTRRHALRRPNTQFVGIDLAHYEPDLPNWRQMRASFSEGLGQLDDESVHEMHSINGLGLYSDIPPHGQGLTQEELARHVGLAHDKLATGGRIRLVLPPTPKAQMVAALRKQGFHGVRARLLREREMDQTHWTRLAKETEGKLYYITARK